MPEPNEGGQGSDPTQAFQNRLAKMEGNALAFATQLFDENWKQRGRIRELEKLVPAEGARVLSKAEAARFDAFEALKKKPEDIAAELAAAETATADVARLKRKDILRDVADIGFGGSKLKLSVLEELDAKLEGAEYEIKEGKDGKFVIVKHGGKETPLDKFATENEKWRDFVPALKVGQASAGASRGNGGDPPPSGDKSTLDRIREQELERQKKAAPPTTGSVRERWFSRRAS